jgi:hypothetical protein
MVALEEANGWLEGVNKFGGRAADPTVVGTPSAL